METRVFLKKYKLEIAIFTLAIVVRCFYLGMSVEAWGGNLNEAVQGSDSYFVLSENILAGNGFSIASHPPYELNSFRTPIMPYFLAVAHEVFGGYGGAVLFQILIASLLPILGMRLAGYITREKYVSVVVGIFLALEPYALLFSTIFYSETVFMLVFFVSLIYFFKYLEDHRFLNLLFSGAFMGFAMLTKPTVEFLPVFLGILILWLWRSDFKRGMLHAIFFCLVCALIVSPWVYRNYIVTGSLGLSPQAGVALYTVLWPSVLSVKNGTSWGTEFDNLIEGGVSGPNDASVKESAEDVKIAVPLLLQNPVPLTIVSAITAFSFFTHDGIYDVLRHIKVRPDQGLGGPALFLAFKDPIAFSGLVVHFVKTPLVLVLIGRIFWIVLTAIFVFGATRYLSRVQKPAGIAAVIIILYFMLTTLTIGFSVNARYRLPVNVFIITFAAYVAIPFITKLHSRYEL